MSERPILQLGVISIGGNARIAIQDLTLYAKVKVKYLEDVMNKKTAANANR